MKDDKGKRILRGDYIKLKFKSRYFYEANGVWVYGKVLDKCPEQLFHNRTIQSVVIEELHGEEAMYDSWSWSEIYKITKEEAMLRKLTR